MTTYVCLPKTEIDTVKWRYRMFSASVCLLRLFFPVSAKSKYTNNITNISVTPEEVYRRGT